MIIPIQQEQEQVTVTRAGTGMAKNERALPAGQ